MWISIRAETLASFLTPRRRDAGEKSTGFTFLRMIASLGLSAPGTSVEVDDLSVGLASVGTDDSDCRCAWTTEIYRGSVTFIRRVGGSALRGISPRNKLYIGSGAETVVGSLSRQSSVSVGVA